MLFNNRIVMRGLVLATLILNSKMKPLRASQVQIGWDKGTSVSGYKIYYGTTSGKPNIIKDVGNTNLATISGLQPSTRYYFTATSYNSSGLESNPSQEITYLVPATTTLPFWYDFRVDGRLDEVAKLSDSRSPYWWLEGGGYFTLSNSIGRSIQGPLPENDYWQRYYSQIMPMTTDNGFHPQNVFQIFLRNKFKDVSASVYVQKKADNIANTSNIQPWNGISLIMRYTDPDNYYYGGIRADGDVVIKKKSNGAFRTLGQTKFFSGTYDSSQNQTLIPSDKWIGLRLIVVNGSSTIPKISFYVDADQTGSWQQVLTVSDDPTKYGPALNTDGLFGIRGDFMDLQMDDVRLADVQTQQSDITEIEEAPYSVLEQLPFNIQLTTSPDKKLHILVSGTIGKTYTIEESTDLRVWRSIDKGTIDSNGYSQYGEETIPNSLSFYRVLGDNSSIVP